MMWAKVSITIMCRAWKAGSIHGKMSSDFQNQSSPQGWLVPKHSHFSETATGNAPASLKFYIQSHS